jgi:carboxyl-terminal processing protease
MINLRKPLSYIVLFLIVFVFGWESASYYIIQKQGSEKNVKQEEVSPVAALSSIIGSKQEKADLNIFWEVWDMLGQSYVDEGKLNNQNMVYGAIKGMVSSLDDPYTVYMTPDETNEFDQNLNGQLEGIGAELTVRDGALVVVYPLKNSPAEKAGLLPGDIVYKIDGQTTSDMTLFDAIMKIRGQKGTKVVLTIMRDKANEPLTVELVRDEVNVDSVSMLDKGNGIYYLTINQFNDTTKPEFDAKVKELLLLEPKGLVLDLRYNGGGYLDSAVDIASEFLKAKDKVSTIKRRSASDNEVLYTTGNPRLPTVPLVVLINGGSASSSEIVAGAIQDHKRGILMGETSFGKGSVQEVDKLSDGSSIRMTIAKWYTPNDKNVSGTGLKPDIEVKMTDADADKDKDPQLDEAIKYLQNLKS